MFMKCRNVFAILAVLAIVLSCVSYSYAKEPADVHIETEKIAEGLYMLWDSSGMGNTSVLTGDDGVLMVDTKSEALVDTLLAKIAGLSKKSVRYVIITHWHFDHIGGNAAIAKTGATIIAHANVRKQMSIDHDMKILNTKVPASPQIALPLLTFTKMLTFHLNGEDINVFHLNPGHTDGDAVVYYQKANVIHMGDLYFEGLYPYIGIYSGGSITSMIDVINKILPMIDKKTIVVPGHGPVSNKSKLKEYVSMLSAVQDNVRRLLQKGKTIEQVIAAKPTRAFDAKWGNGFLTPDQFAKLVYMDLSPEMP